MIYGQHPNWAEAMQLEAERDAPQSHQTFDRPGFAYGRAIGAFLIHGAVNAATFTAGTVITGRPIWQDFDAIGKNPTAMVLFGLAVAATAILAPGNTTYRNERPKLFHWGTAVLGALTLGLGALTGASVNEQHTTDTPVIKAHEAVVPARPTGPR